VRISLFLTELETVKGGSFRQLPIASQNLFRRDGTGWGGENPRCWPLLGLESEVIGSARGSRRTSDNFRQLPTISDWELPTTSDNFRLLHKKFTRFHSGPSMSSSGGKSSIDLAVIRPRGLTTFKGPSVLHQSKIVLVVLL
jgi:hypothetical protein